MYFMETKIRINHKQHIDTTISSEDYEYVKKRGLKFSNLLASAIAVDRTAFDSGESGDAFKSMKRRMDAAIERLNKTLEFIDKEGLTPKLIQHNIDN